MINKGIFIECEIHILNYLYYVFKFLFIQNNPQILIKIFIPK